jgi:hypothetical protein
MTDPDRRGRLIAALTLFALVALVAAYFSPVWWVSLTAPNYPKDAFPDGIRIHFHFDGVKNGCRIAGTGSRLAQETMQGDLGQGSDRFNPVTDGHKDVNKGAQGLDCVHEMNTINHYVGMFPHRHRRAGGETAGQVLLCLVRGHAGELRDHRQDAAPDGAGRRLRGDRGLGRGRPVPAGSPAAACGRLRQGGWHLLQGTRPDQGLGRQRHDGPRTSRSACWPWRWRWSGWGWRACAASSC